MDQLDQPRPDSTRLHLPSELARLSGVHMRKIRAAIRAERARAAAEARQAHASTNEGFTSALLSNERVIERVDQIHAEVVAADAQLVG